MEILRLRKLLKLFFLVACLSELCFLIHDEYSDNRESKGDDYEEKSKSLQAIRHELMERSRYINSVCLKTGNLKSKQSNSNLFHKVKLRSPTSPIVWMPEKRLAWCVVPKAASTSIASAIIEINNQTSMLEDKRQVQAFLKKHYSEISSVVLGKAQDIPYTSFYVTRHPFERIVSAFKDKLENSSVHDGLYFYRIYGKQIVKRFRKKQSLAKNATKEPTFREFASYLINTDVHHYDNHWKPISLLCDVCHFSYNYSLKVESFNVEFEALLKQLKQTKSLPESFKIHWQNKRNEDDQRTAVAKTYMKKLPREYVKRLYEIYKADFIYFKYNESGYY